MKYKFWILLIIIGGALMIVGSAIGSAGFYEYLISFAIPYVSPEYLPLVSALLTILQYIAYFGGYSVLVGVLLIILKFNKLGRIIISLQCVLITSPVFAFPISLKSLSCFSVRPLLSVLLILEGSNGNNSSIVNF